MKPYQILRLDQSAEVYIFGDIVALRWFDDETSADSFRRELQDLAADGVSELNVHIDSYGGEISEGWAIYNTLKDWPGQVNTYADGFVASAAVYPFIAGKKRYANPMSAFYLHQSWTKAQGNADDLRKAADDIEKLNAIGLEAFAAAGMDKAKILELERDETWLTAAEALELGLATEIIDRSDEAGAQQSVRGMIVEALKAYGSRKRAKEPIEPANPNTNQRESASALPSGAAGEVNKNHLMAFLTKANEKRS